MLRVLELWAALLTLCIRDFGFAEFFTFTSFYALPPGLASCLLLLGAMAKLLFALVFVYDVTLVPYELVT